MTTVARPLRRINEPEYLALRAAHEAAKGAADPARAALLAMLEERPWLLDDVAQHVKDRLPDDHADARVADEFLRLARAERAAWDARSTWIEEHPEHR